MSIERKKAAAEIRRLAPDVGRDTEEILADMYTAKKLSGTSSEPIEIDTLTRLNVDQGARLHRLIRERDISRSLEIGFAYGFSTVWILDALRPRKNARHRAIDPFELEWGGVGLRQVERLGITSPAFEWISERSQYALAMLIKQKEKFDFIFIDGAHRFDDVLVDFYLSDQLVCEGGLIVFDDMWMPSVSTVASFVLTNRQYETVHSWGNIIVLKKIADDKRDWTHFEKFIIHSPLRMWTQDYRGRLSRKLKSAVLKSAHATGTYGLLRRIKDGGK